jgi:predicted nuclease of predicted toxin-antitoxin system
MKLFFDENLSPQLVRFLREEYPDSSHVRNVSMVGSSDSQIWDYCKKNNFTVVSKDTDFRERSMAEGFPTKIVWLDVENAGTSEIANLLRREQGRIEHFLTQSYTSLLILSINGNAI